MSIIFVYIMYGIESIIIYMQMYYMKLHADFYCAFKKMYEYINSLGSHIHLHIKYKYCINILNL